MFNSHNGWKSTSKCTWSGEYGDGFFRVTQDVLGDFSIMCRFGGHHAMTRDKTTLIFKYQNSTAFMPAEVVELKRVNVDVNPEYSDSLDIELFTVHLMFERCSSSSNSAGSSGAVSPLSPMTSRLPPSACLPQYEFSNKRSFEIGLDEISKHHGVEPDGLKSTALTRMGFPEQYSTVALQLSNNSMDTAAELILSMKNRAEELCRIEKNYEIMMSRKVAHDSSGSLASIASEDPIAESKDGCTVVEVEGQGRAISAPPQGQTISSPHPAIGVNALSSATLGSQSTLLSSMTVFPVCPVCCEDSVMKREQLISCSSCQRYYHTVCCNLRRIPFSLKTTKERVNRDKYVVKYYSQWACTNCDGSGSIGSSSGAAAGKGNQENASANPNPNTSLAAPGMGKLSISTHRPAPPSPVPAEAQLPPAHSHISGPAMFSPMTKTKHDQAAMLIGLLSAQGISLEALMAMSEDRQKEVLIASASKSKLPAAADSGSHLAGAAVAGAPGSAFKASAQPVLSALSPTNATGAGVMPPSIFDGMVTQGTSSPQLSSSAKTAAASSMLQSYANAISSNSGTAADAGGGASPMRGSSALAASVYGAEKVTLRDRSPMRGAAVAAVEVVTTGSGSGAGSSSAASSSNADQSPSRPKSLHERQRIMAEMLLNRKSNMLGAPTGGVAEPPSRENPAPNPATATGVSATPPAELDSGVRLRDDEKYAKYLKMVKIGLPKPSVAQKMFKDGVVDTFDSGLILLEGDLDKPAPAVAATPVAMKKAEPVASGDTIVVSEHETYRKFFKMLKVGMPAEMVKMKMTQEGVDASYLDKDPMDLIPVTAAAAAAEKDGAHVAVSLHPDYAKYFQMVKMGLPREAVRHKMLQDKVDASYLDKDPAELVPLGKVDAKVPVSLHPRYAKYFKMLKVGISADMVRAKMTQEGVDASYLDKDPMDLISELADDADTKAKSKIVLPVKKPTVRKKKLYWKAIDQSKISGDSLWADDDKDDIALDVAEFNQLFVESVDSSSGNVVKKAMETKKTKVNLIDAKRGQNAGIALARIKLPHADIRKRVEVMSDEAFSTDQLHSLQEYLPSADEVAILKTYRGDVDMLGQAEQYMLTMCDLKTASQRIQCMIYKQQFKGRVAESKITLSKIEKACEDVKMSLKLKKVLKTILKVGNQMNDGEDHVGFTLDSLLKLQSAKAFDKKTSILQYVITLVYRNDETCLSFPDDLGHIADASRLTIEAVQAEIKSLSNATDLCLRSVELFKKSECDGQISLQLKNGSDAMFDFLLRAEQTIRETESIVTDVQAQFGSVLAYFGEEPSMSSQEFFSTLQKFVQAFIQDREIVIRKVKAEAKAQAKEASDLEKESNPKAIKRSSISVTSLASVFRSATSTVAGRADSGRPQSAALSDADAQAKATSPFKRRVSALL